VRRREEEDRKKRIIDTKAEEHCTSEGAYANTKEKRKEQKKT